MKKILLFMLGVLLALPGIARDFTYEYEGQTLTYTVIDEEAKTCMTKKGSYDGYTVTPGNFVSGVLEIPSIAKDGDVEYTVIEIGHRSFYNSNLKSVIIPPSVNSVGKDAFEWCFYLDKSAYPSGLNCPFIRGAKIQYPREGAIIEDGFVYGSERKAILFAPLSLEGEYIIPESVISIGEYAFYNCENLRSVIIHPSVNSVGKDAFTWSGLRKSAYPSGLNGSIGTGAQIQYPREGALIEDGFVYGPEKSAIYFAPLSLAGEYIIPESVASISDEAFSGCDNLTSVKATTIKPPVMGDDSFEGLYATTVLSVPEEGAIDYIISNWSLFENLRIGDSESASRIYETGNLRYRLIPGKTEDDQNLAVVVQGDYSSLTEVTIPERFTVSENGTNYRYFVYGIGFQAFKECSDLKTVTFNSRNASKIIGDYAFAGTRISTLTLPATVESIGNYAFYDCRPLKNVEIPEGVETIGNNAFTYCNSLEKITIPGTVKTIGDYAFFKSGLKEVVLQEGVGAIGIGSFAGLTFLKKVTLNEGIESIGESAFERDYTDYNQPFDSIYIPSTLRSIGKNAFRNVTVYKVNVSNLAAWCGIDFDNAYSNPLHSGEAGLFVNDEQVTDFTAENISEIKPFAFYNCN